MSDPVLNFNPARVDLRGTAGDSIVFTVTVDDISKLPNPVWKAQARDGEGNNPQEFRCEATADGVIVILDPDQTRTLSQLPSARRAQRVANVGSAVAVWQGEYDLQVTHDPDMVRTLLQGAIFLQLDVTR